MVVPSIGLTVSAHLERDSHGWSSRRRLQQASDADLAALAEVATVVASEIEASAQSGGDVTSVVQAITQSAIAVETEVVEEAKQLGQGTLSTSDFTASNTAAKFTDKRQQMTVPSSMMETFSSITGITYTASSTKKDDDEATIIIAVVCSVGGLLVLSLAGFLIKKQMARGEGAEDKVIPK